LAARAQAWLNVLAKHPVPSPTPDLLEKTHAAVQAERMKLPASSDIVASPSRRVAASSHPSFFRRHLKDVAAMLVAACILVAVIIPSVTHISLSYRRTLCAANLSTVGINIQQYTADNASQLPALANMTGDNWFQPSSGGHTNTANLFPLVLARYTPSQRLHCPGDGYAESAPAAVSNVDIPDCGYSYTNLFGPVRRTWDGKNSSIILADKNPLFVVNNRTVSSDKNSPNHGGYGQYCLRADRSVTWETNPNVGPAKDNIWTVSTSPNQRLLTYTGTETPTNPNDIFLAP
jgi:hypothetical protein